MIDFHQDDVLVSVSCIDPGGENLSTAESILVKIVIGIIISLVEMIVQSSDDKIPSVVRANGCIQANIEELVLAVVILSHHDSLGVIALAAWPPLQSLMSETQWNNHKLKISIFLSYC
jgi:hypothetical protein